MTSSMRSMFTRISRIIEAADESVRTGAMKESRTDSAILTCRDLAVGYGEAVLCGGIDLTVHAGEYVSLVGPPGCGKTYGVAAMCAALGLPLGVYVCQSNMEESHVEGDASGSAI